MRQEQSLQLRLQVDVTGGFATPACIAAIDGASAIGRNEVYPIPDPLIEETFAEGGVSQPAGSVDGVAVTAGDTGDDSGGGARRLQQAGTTSGTKGQRRSLANEVWHNEGGSQMSVKALACRPLQTPSMASALADHHRFHLCMQAVDRRLRRLF